MLIVLGGGILYPNPQAKTKKIKTKPKPKTQTNTFLSRNFPDYFVSKVSSDTARLEIIPLLGGDDN